MNIVTWTKQAGNRNKGKRLKFVYLFVLVSGNNFTRSLFYILHFEPNNINIDL